MRTKLSLNLDDLRVVTFDTTAPHKEKGTVFGEQCTCYTNCTCPGCPSCVTCGPTCDTYPTDGCSCVATCQYTCEYTCDDRSCVCNTWDPCTTAQYTHCNGLDCL